MQSSNISINEVQLFTQSLAIEFLSNEELARYAEDLEQVLATDLSKTMKQEVIITILL
jgi:hypothetical protein